MSAELSSDLGALQRSLLLSRDVLNSIDRQVDGRQKEQQLIDIYNKLDARSSALFRAKKFKVSADGRALTGGEPSDRRTVDVIIATQIVTCC